MSWQKMYTIYCRQTTREGDFTVHFNHWRKVCKQNLHSLMKFAHFSLIVVSLSVSALGFGQSARVTLQGRYDEISKLSIRKNKAGLSKVIRRNATSNFEFIDGMKNSLDIGATVRQNTEQIAGVYKFVSDTNRIVKIRQVGDDLVCTVKTNYDAFLDRRLQSRIQGVSISEDTWTKTIVGWKIKKSVVVKESAMKNGQVLTASI